MGKEPSLTVAGTGMEESILQTVLDSCENTRTTITNIMKKNPEMDIETITNLLSTDSLVKEVSLGGRTIDGNMQFRSEERRVGKECRSRPACTEVSLALALRSGSRPISHLWQPDGV